MTLIIKNKIQIGLYCDVMTFVLHQLVIDFQLPVQSVPITPLKLKVRTR